MNFSFGRRPSDADVSGELRAHLEMAIRDHVARGATPADARLLALKEFGNVTVVRETTHDMWGSRWADALGQDVKLAVRGLLRQRGWTAVAVATLALGIGANSALFTIINAVLLRPLPYPQSDRIVSISQLLKGVDTQGAADYEYVEWQRTTRSMTALAAYSSTSSTLTGAGDPEAISGYAVTPSYFAVLGVAPRQGRTFTPDETRLGSPAVVVISDQLWHGHFGADPNVLGRQIVLNDKPRTVIGIMPASFTTQYRGQFWTPLSVDLASHPNASFYVSVIGRLRPGVTVADAQRELAAISARLDVEHPPGFHFPTGVVPVVMTLHQRRSGDTRFALLLLFGAVGVLLLIACANVTSLLLARAARRQREFAVRITLGASRSRLVRYLLTESLILSVAGALVGLGIAALTIGAIVRSSPDSIAHVEGIRVDSTVLTFCLVLSVATGVLFGLVPAMHAGRTDLHQLLTEGSSRSTNSQRQNALRRVLVVGQLATALLLATCAGLLTRSFANVTAIDLGFRPAHLLVASVGLTPARYRDDANWRAFVDALRAQVRALPGVQRAALGREPIGGPMGVATVKLADGSTSPPTDFDAVGSGYFETLGTAVESGRLFTTADEHDSNAVVVINQTMARTVFGGVSPIGKRISNPVTGSGLMTVIGVVHDMPEHGLEAATNPEVYGLIEQGAEGPYLSLLVRTSGDPLQLEGAVRATFRDLDPRLAVAFTTVDQVVSTAIGPRRLGVIVLGAFALLATVLAAVGLYGTMAYAVADRTRELGIRVALGADRAQLIRSVVGEGMLLAGIGIAIGLSGSIAAVRLLRTMVFGIGIYDPSTFVASAGVLAAIALLACLVPARRATRVDPVLALRSE